MVGGGESFGEFWGGGDIKDAGIASGGARDDRGGAGASGEGD